MLTNEQREILIGYGYEYCPGALAATSQAERDEAMVFAWQCNFE